MLEREINLRSCTVRCLRNDSCVVSIDRSALFAIIRRNPQVLSMMKKKWTQFLIKRVSNKLFVEQINKKMDEK